MTELERARRELVRELVEPKNGEALLNFERLVREDERGKHDCEADASESDKLARVLHNSIQIFREALDKQGGL